MIIAWKVYSGVEYAVLFDGAHRHADRDLLVDLDEEAPSEHDALRQLRAAKGVVKYQAHRELTPLRSQLLEVLSRLPRQEWTVKELRAETGMDAGTMNGLLYRLWQHRVIDRLGWGRVKLR